MVTSLDPIVEMSSLRFNNWKKKQYKNKYNYKTNLT